MMCSVLGYLSEIYELFSSCASVKTRTSCTVKVVGTRYNANPNEHLTLWVFWRDNERTTVIFSDELESCTSKSMRSNDDFNSQVIANNHLGVRGKEFWSTVVQVRIPDWISRIPLRFQRVGMLIE